MSEIQQTPTSPLMKLRQKIFPQSEIKVIRKDLEKVFDRLLSLSLSFFLSDLELPITFNFLLSKQALWKCFWASQYSSLLLLKWTQCCIKMEENCFGFIAVPPGNQLRTDIYNDIQAASLPAKKQNIYDLQFPNAF